MLLKTWDVFVTYTIDGTNHIFSWLSIYFSLPQGSKLTFVARGHCGPSNWECWGGLQKSGAHRKIKLEFKSYKRYSSATECFARYRFTNVFEKTRGISKCDLSFDSWKYRVLGRGWPRLQHFAGRNSNLRGVPPPAPANFEPCCEHCLHVHWLEWNVFHHVWVYSCVVHNVWV